jgi:hypothetical protein
MIIADIKAGHVFQHIPSGNNYFILAIRKVYDKNLGLGVSLIELKSLIIFPHYYLNDNVCVYWKFQY